jgi:hypothetical protein
MPNLEILVLKIIIRPKWHKSSKSAVDGHCVEIAVVGRFIFVRDSKRPSGPYLRVSRKAWKAFISDLELLSKSWADTATPFFPLSVGR